jgi:hypothetical protein
LKKNHLKENVTIDNVGFRLKKVFKIIYSYHINNKKILFIGNPLNINKELISVLKSTKHTFIPKSAWVAGSITANNTTSFKFVLDRSVNFKISQRLQKLKKKNDLVIILNEKSDLIALEESYSNNIPVVSLNSSLNPFNFKPSYKIPGNFIFSKNKLKNNFFYSLLLSTLKRSIKVKKKFRLTHKLLTPSVFKKIKKYKKYFRK